jgi:hypothetical protein
LAKGHKGLQRPVQPIVVHGVAGETGVKRRHELSLRHLAL